MCNLPEVFALDARPLEVPGEDRMGEQTFSGLKKYCNVLQLVFLSAPRSFLKLRDLGKGLITLAF